MEFLHNRKGRDILEAELAAETFDRIPASFYRYVKIEDPKAFRDQLYRELAAHKAFGRVYVASEGVNAQLSIPEHAFEDVGDSLRSLPELSGLFINRSSDRGNDAFIKLTIKVREKIVADGLEDDLFEVSSPGEHLSPKAFHQALEDPETIVVDARNDYEGETGRFEGAWVPSSKTFSDVLPEIKSTFERDKDKKVVMYCTGGIRCEKASAYLKKEGFSNVGQLKGGIINYLNDMQKEGLPSKFQGSLFVFDGRMAEPTVGETLSRCQQCGAPHDVHSDCANETCHVLMLQCGGCRDKYQGCCSKACQEEVLSRAELTG